MQQHIFYFIKLAPQTPPQLQQTLEAFFSNKTSKLNPLLQCLFDSQRNKLFFIFSIKYLYHFMSSQSQFKLREIVSLIEQIMRKCKKCTEQIVSFKKFCYSGDSRIVAEMQSTQLTLYLSRLISLPVIFMNLSSDLRICNDFIETRSTIRLIEKNIVLSILQILQQINEDDSFFLVNKLLVLGHQSLIIPFFIDKQKQQVIFNLYFRLSKKNKVLIQIYKLYLIKKTQKLKEILYKLQSDHQLGNQVIYLMNSSESSLLSQKKYETFYEIFCSNKLKPKIVSQLLNWWSASRHNMTTSKQSHFRCNLLAYILQRCREDQIIQGEYMSFIAEGIQKRMTDRTKDEAFLIWKIIAEKIGVEISKDIRDEGKFFEIDEDRQQIQKMEQLPTQMLKKINKQGQNEQQSPKIPITSFTEKQLNIQQNQEYVTAKLNEPKNIYDCILALRNPSRQQIALKKLPQLIRKYPQDLSLMWNSLMKQLLNPLNQRYGNILIILFVNKPTDFIEMVCQIFLKTKLESNVSQKICLMSVLSKGIEQLSENPQKLEPEQDNGKDFYFKKVRSKYYKDTPDQSLKKDNEKTRRWGHTRIAHEQKQQYKKGSLITSLKIVKSEEPYINRFYEIANLLFFKIISKIQVDIEESLKKHQILVQHLLKMFSTLASHLKNHYDKYIILDDIAKICLKILLFIEKNKSESTKRQENGGNTLILTVQCLNKISLIVDKFLPQSLLQSFKRSILTLKGLPHYGIRPIVDMVQANIYRNLQLSRDEI